MQLPPDILARLVGLYSEPRRHYHNWAHVQSCLRELSTVRQECAHPEDVELALYFHDAVYDPTRGDNEARSAALARELLVPLLPHDRLGRIEHRIVSTDHRHVPADPDGRLICDIVLSILAQPAEIFDAYDAAIRREYAHVPDEDFAAG